MLVSVSFGTLIVVSVGYQRIDHWMVRRIGNPSSLVFCKMLVKSKWGRIVQLFRTRSRCKNRTSFAFPLERKAAQVADWIEECVS